MSRVSKAYKRYFIIRLRNNPDTNPMNFNILMIRIWNWWILEIGKKLRHDSRKHQKNIKRTISRASHWPQTIKIPNLKGFKNYPAPTKWSNRVLRTENAIQWSRKNKICIDVENSLYTPSKLPVRIYPLPVRFSLKISKCLILFTDIKSDKCLMSVSPPRGHRQTEMSGHVPMIFNTI